MRNIVLDYISLIWISRVRYTINGKKTCLTMTSDAHRKKGKREKGAQEGERDEEHIEDHHRKSY
jgi:hypothetical protein